jgi:hypothetical protein
MSKRYLFPFTFNREKNQYEIICGSNKNEWGIELLELGDYLCWFGLVIHRNIPKNNEFIKLCAPKNAKEMSYIYSDQFFIRINLN